MLFQTRQDLPVMVSPAHTAAKPEAPWAGDGSQHQLTLKLNDPSCQIQALLVTQDLKTLLHLKSYFLIFYFLAYWARWGRG